MSKNTGIRIEAVREISGNGDQGYKIVAVEALLDNQLPKFYLAGDRPIIYIWHNGSKNSLQKQPGFSYITVGDFIPVQKMKKILAHIKTAGQHLADVNAHLAKKQEAWRGKVIFVDGIEQEQEKDTALSKQSTAERIAKLGGEGRLLYRNSRGHIKPLKPSTPPPSSHQAGLGKYHKSKIRRSKNHG